MESPGTTRAFIPLHEREKIRHQAKARKTLGERLSGVSLVTSGVSFVVSLWSFSSAALLTYSQQRELLLNATVEVTQTVLDIKHDKQAILALELEALPETGKSKDERAKEEARISAEFQDTTRINAIVHEASAIQQDVNPCSHWWCHSAQDLAEMRARILFEVKVEKLNLDFERDRLEYFKKLRDMDDQAREEVEAALKKLKGNPRKTR